LVIEVSQSLVLVLTHRDFVCLLLVQRMAIGVVDDDSDEEKPRPMIEETESLEAEPAKE
jgi:hypothetical protein